MSARNRRPGNFSRPGRSGGSRNETPNQSSRGRKYKNERPSTDRDFYRDKKDERGNDFSSSRQDHSVNRYSRFGKDERKGYRRREDSPASGLDSRRGSRSEEFSRYPSGSQRRERFKDSRSNLTSSNKSHPSKDKVNELVGSIPDQGVFENEARSDLLWGRHSTQAVLESGRPVHRIWCTQELRSSSRFLQLLREAKSSGVLVEEVTWARLGQLTHGAVHQGIALQTASAETLDLQTLLSSCIGLDESPLLLALDGLTDPQNLGAIVRSAEALGAHGLILPQRRSAGLTGSVAKVAAGALEHLPVARVVNLNRSIEELKKNGYRIIGLAEEGDVTLSEVDLEGPLVVLTGAEDKGISLVTRRHCDQLVRIPLRGMTNSLNASVATALLLYEVARRGWMKGLSGQAPSPRIIRAKCNASSKVSKKQVSEIQPTEGVDFADQISSHDEKSNALKEESLEEPCSLSLIEPQNTSGPFEQSIEL